MPLEEFGEWWDSKFDFATKRRWAQAIGDPELADYPWNTLDLVREQTPLFEAYNRLQVGH